ncbi:MAG: T9SS type A sorting domain-containing protein, partial [Crocinitomicaceae bacterium]
PVTYVTCIEIQPDNKILLGGDFTTFDGQTWNYIIRLNEDGTIDNTFNIGAGFNDEVETIFYSPQGKIYVGGYFTQYNGNTHNRIVCLNPDGSVDPSFNSGTGFTGSVQTIKSFGNRLIVGGGFLNYNGTSATAMAVLETNGSLYTGFTSVINDSWPATVTNLCVQPDNKIIIGGYYFLAGPQNAFARVLEDGAIDTTFTPLVMNANQIRTSYLRSSGQILIGGFFTSINNYPVNCLALLENNGVGFGNLSLTFDSISNLNCSSALASGQAIASNGAPPIQYSWQNSSDPMNPSQIFNSGGMKTCTITDSLGQSITESIFISSPSSSSEYDLTAHVIAGTFRPGFDVNVSLDAFNSGCVPISGEVNLILDSLVSFVSSIPTPSSISGDTLTWNFPQLYFDSAHFTPQLTLNTSVSAQIGDSITLEASINPTLNDANSSDNNKTYVHPVLNGYDPNDKQVYPLGKCDEKYIEYDESLTYTVRFQNTGNSEAINIAIIDSLDTTLDISSVQLLAASHEVLMKGLSQNVLKFEFDSILLPDSLSNEPLSHGYVIFKINPAPNVPHSTIIENKVEIYFDFNPPIITNTTWNTLFVGDLDTLNCFPFASIPEYDNTSNYFGRVYPNPFNDEVSLEINKELIGETLELLDEFGKILFQTNIESENFTIDLHNIKAGLYILRIDGYMHKIVKL